VPILRGIEEEAVVVAAAEVLAGLVGGFVGQDGDRRGRRLVDRVARRRLGGVPASGHDGALGNGGRRGGRGRVPRGDGRDPVLANLARGGAMLEPVDLVVRTSNDVSSTAVMPPRAAGTLGGSAQAASIATTAGTSRETPLRMRPP